MCNNGVLKTMKKLCLIFTWELSFIHNTCTPALNVCTSEAKPTERYVDQHEASRPVDFELTRP